MTGSVPLFRRPCLRPQFPAWKKINALRLHIRHCDVELRGCNKRRANTTAQERTGHEEARNRCDAIGGRRRAGGLPDAPFLQSWCTVCRSGVRHVCPCRDMRPGSRGLRTGNGRNDHHEPWGYGHPWNVDSGSRDLCSSRRYSISPALDRSKHSFIRAVTPVSTAAASSRRPS
jgi:hypothetical protein